MLQYVRDSGRSVVIFIIKLTVKVNKKHSSATLLWRLAANISASHTFKVCLVGFGNWAARIEGHCCCGVTEWTASGVSLIWNAVEFSCERCRCNPQSHFLVRQQPLMQQDLWGPCYRQRGGDEGEAATRIKWLDSLECCTLSAWRTPF